MIIECKRHHKDAILPTSNYDTDTGYDINFVSMEIESFKDNEDNHLFDLYVYDTGISIKPPKGYYVDMIPRSGFGKYGHVLINSIGVIDSEYRGTIKAKLYKLLPNIPNLSLPGRYFQLVLRPIIKAGVKEVDNFEETIRGDKGFGSSGK